MLDQAEFNAETVKLLREQHGLNALLTAKLDYALRRIDILSDNSVLSPPARSAMESALADYKSAAAKIAEEGAIHLARLERLFGPS